MIKEAIRDKRDPNLACICRIIVERNILFGFKVSSSEEDKFQDGGAQKNYVLISLA